jgi:TPR repeat protein
MRIPFLLSLFFASTAACASPVPASLREELQVAEKALAKKDYEQAHREYAAHADENPLAQFVLGLFESSGWGRPVDPVQACAWFDKAAQRQVPAAEHFLGDCFARGTGRAVDAGAAERWYLKAAASGIPYALCSAGGMYIAGTIVDKDVRRGLNLCTQAAQAESVPAMRRLADHYREGTQVPQDLAAARYWYQQAAERHDHEAQYRLGLMLNEGQGGQSNPALALSWFEHAAREGYAPAYLPVAVLYANAAPDPGTGALAPDTLAKIYVWNAVAKRSAPREDGARAQIARIETLVMAVLPLQWKDDLDRQVAEHLAKYPAPS